MSTTPGRLLRVALTALITTGVLFGTLSCSGENSGSGGSGESTSDTASEAGYVTGDVEAWLTAACGEDSEISESDDPTARYGENATASWYCQDPGSFDQGGGNASYLEATTFDADPSADWVPIDEPGNFMSRAIGQVSEDEWVVVYEDSSRTKLTDPHLEPLLDFGFEVMINNQPIS